LLLLLRCGHRLGLLQLLLQGCGRCRSCKLLLRRRQRRHRRRCDALPRRRRRRGSPLRV
jgi:hypothetical protein